MRKISLFLIVLICCAIYVEAQNLLPHKVGDKYGFSSVPDQKMIIQPQFEDAFNFSEGLAPVVKNGKFGFINKTGKVVIDFKYDDAFEFENGGAVVKLNDKFGIINKKSKDILPPIFDQINPFDGKGAWGVYEGTKGYVIRLSSKMLVFRTRDGELYLQL